jgi:hypothetical protein
MAARARVHRAPAYRPAAKCARKAPPSWSCGSIVQSSALSALERRLLVDDEGSLLPTHRAGTLSAVPNRLGGFDNSDDRRCLLLFAKPEEAVQLLQPSGAATEPRALHNRAAHPRQSSAIVLRLGITSKAERAGHVLHERGLRFARTRRRGPNRRAQTARSLRAARRMCWHGIAILWRRVGVRMTVHDGAVSMLVRTEGEEVCVCELVC